MVSKISKDSYLCKAGQKVVLIQGSKEETAEEKITVKIIEIQWKHKDKGLTKKLQKLNRLCKIYYK